MGPWHPGAHVLPAAAGRKPSPIPKRMPTPRPASCVLRRASSSRAAALATNLWPAACGRGAALATKLRSAAGSRGVALATHLRPASCGRQCRWTCRGLAGAVVRCHGSASAHSKGAQRSTAQGARRVTSRRFPGVLVSGTEPRRTKPQLRHVHGAKSHLSQIKKRRCGHVSGARP